MGATGKPGILLRVWVSQRARERWGSGSGREGEVGGGSGRGTIVKIDHLIMSDCITEVTFLLFITVAYITPFSPIMDRMWLTLQCVAIRLVPSLGWWYWHDHQLYSTFGEKVMFLTLHTQVLSNFCL